MLHILSYNIHKGFSVGNRQFLLGGIREAIRSTGADLLCLQEVVGENTRHASTVDNWVGAQFEYLADSVWHHHAYGRNALYDHGHHGNAILSRYPLQESRNHDISVLPMSQRGILHAVTEQGVHVLCAHFGLLGWERLWQLRKLEDLLQSIPPDAPLILAGDFNDWQLKTHRLLLQLGLREVMQERQRQPAKTYPAWYPMLRMDRIYYRNLHLRQTRRLDGAQWRLLSDHCPLYAEFSG